MLYQGHSISNQQFWMESHAPDLLCLIQNVQNEITEQVTELVMSKIQKTNYKPEVLT
jgi:hypothetical protein